MSLSLFYLLSGYREARGGIALPLVWLSSDKIPMTLGLEKSFLLRTGLLKKENTLTDSKMVAFPSS